MDFKAPIPLKFSARTLFPGAIAETAKPAASTRTGIPIRSPPLFCTYVSSFPP